MFILHACSHDYRVLAAGYDSSLEQGDLDGRSGCGELVGVLGTVGSDIEVLRINEDASGRSSDLLGSHTF